MRLHRALCCITAAAAFSGPPRPPRNPRRSNGFDEDPDEGLRLGRAASTAITLAVGASAPTLARRYRRRKAPAADKTAADPHSFAGTWKLARSENMDAYLKSLNVSATHRRLAAGASVVHEIEQDSRDCVDVCVVTRLGKSREQQQVGAARPGKDQYGRPITKRTTWEGRKLKTTTESEVGTVTDVRERAGEGMVITLTSPDGVVARRFFERTGAAPAAVPAMARQQPVRIVFATGFEIGNSVSAQN